MSQDGMTEIGKYRIEGQIGEGAMGVVYRAVDPVLNRTVAIKVMSDALSRDDDLRGRFLREAQAAGSLQHPNLITIYDFGEVDGHPYIAMEYVAGNDLEDLIVRKAPLTITEKIDIIIDVLGGLAYAHKRGIIHRDIKPANIRIDEDGRGRIMDFGIAHLTSSKMTKTGIMVGTPAYMAPEQIIGNAIVPASDIFSVGAVMFELLTGKKPFAAESLQSVFYKIVSAPVPSVLDDAPETPAALNPIIQKALAKEPADRYTTALEMANALTAVRATLGNQQRRSKSISLQSSIDTGLARQPTMMAKRSGENKKNTKVLATVGGGVLVVIIAGVMLMPSRNKTAPPANQPPAGAPVPAPQPATTSAPTATTTTPASPAPVTPEATPASASTAAVAPVSSPAKAASKSNDAAAVAREQAMFRTMQPTALDARRRAVEAGATTEQLAVGDDHNKRATILAADGKVPDAVTRLNLATTAWSNAERDARAAAAATAAAAASKTRVVEQPKIDVPPVAPPIAAPQQPVIAPPVTPATRTPAANPTADISAVVAAYARAIDSRDVNEVRRAYPGATAEQAKGFEQFFSSVKSLHATLTVSDLEITGATAEARLSGAYDYATTAGKAERQPLDFKASFRRDAGGWKLVSVRAP